MLFLFFSIFRVFTTPRKIKDIINCLQETINIDCYVTTPGCKVKQEKFWFTEDLSWTSVSDLYLVFAKFVCYLLNHIKVKSDPVANFILGYIMFGAALFSAWEVFRFSFLNQWIYHIWFWRAGLFLTGLTSASQAWWQLDLVILFLVTLTSTIHLARLCCWKLSVTNIL